MYGEESGPGVSGWGSEDMRHLEFWPSARHEEALCLPGPGSQDSVASGYVQHL